MIDNIMLNNALYNALRTVIDLPDNTTSIDINIRMRMDEAPTLTTTQYVQRADHPSSMTDEVVQRFKLVLAED